MSKSSNSSIKFGFWNIGGLCTRGMNKAEGSIFLWNIEPYDIMFLVETHIGYNSKIHNIGNFHYQSICRNVSNNNRHVGGIAILIKSYIKPHVKILKNTNVDYQPVKLENPSLNSKKIYSSVLLIIHLFLLNTLRS